MAKGVPTTIYLDKEIDHKIDIKRMEDKGFNLSKIVSAYLKEYFNIDDDDSLEKESKEIENLKEEIKTKRKVLDAKIAAHKRRLEERDSGIGEVVWES